MHIYDSPDYDFEKELSEITIKEGEKNTFFESEDFKVDEKNGLIYTDEELKKKQRGVLSHMMKQMGMNLIAGKSIMDISLPIKIFDK